LTGGRKNTVHSTLKRDLRPIDIFSIATGAMISSGLFILPGLAHAKTGPSVVVSYFLAGLLAVTGMLSQAELVSAMPKAGGTYFYVTRSMGPAAGTVDGIITWLSISFKSAFALLGMAAFISVFITYNIHAVAVTLALLFIAVNFFGVGKAGKLQTILVFFLILLLIIYNVKGVSHIEIKNFGGFAPAGLAGIVSTAGYVFISYGGLLKVASIAEEAENPGKTIPMGMIFSLVVVMILYSFTVFITTGVLEPSALDNSLTPISDGAQVFMGPAGKMLMSIAAVLAFISTANAGIMAASRYPLALSRDDLLPSPFGRINRRFKTPHISLMVTGGVIIVVLFLKLDTLVKAASTVLILSFFLACLSIIVLRESRVQNYRPTFKAPLYPWLQLAGLLGLSAALIGMGSAGLYTSGIFLAAGFLVYWFYGRKRTDREFALIHLIERIVNKDIAGDSLETELREIIRERDDITMDRFDRIIENSTIMDITEKLSYRDFFLMAADALAKKTGIGTDYIFNALMVRETSSSTVINPFVAIPHIITEGTGTFEILVARLRKGAVFSEKDTGVKAVFILLGTPDERNFHLKALSAIAQIVQNPKFEEMWTNARAARNLRDIILLGERRRHD